MNIVNEIFGKAILATKIRGLEEKIIEANNTDKRECGHCYFWMMSSSCPREKNVNGRSRGPSMSGVVCSKFKLKQWVIDLKKERLDNIKKEIALLKEQK